jgi:hypothetical protein
MHLWSSCKFIPNFVGLYANFETLIGREKRGVLAALQRPCHTPHPSFGHPVQRARADFAARYDSPPPALFSLTIELTEYAFHKAKTAAESAPVWGEVVAAGAEGVDAIRESVEIHEQVVECFCQIQLSNPVAELVSITHETLRASTELTIEACLATALTSKSQLLTLKFSSLFQVIQQLDLLARGKTDAWSAGTRSAIAIIAIGLSTWGAKAAGAVAGFFLGGATGAAWVGTVASVAASHYTAKWLAQYFVREVGRALDRLNTLELRRARRMAKARARTVAYLNSTRTAAELMHQSHWRTVWSKANESLSKLYQNYLLIAHELFDAAYSEMLRMIADIDDGTSRKDFLSTLTFTQRAAYWCSKSTRQSVAEHFQIRLDTLDRVLSEASRPIEFEDRLLALLTEMHNGLLYTPGMCAHVERFLEEVSSLCGRARCIRLEVEQQLMQRDLRLISDHRTAIIPSVSRYHRALARAASVATEHRSKVVKLADKAGLNLVFTRQHVSST